MARVQVSQTMRGTVTDARARDDSGRGGRGRDSAVVTRPRLLVILFRLCCSRRCDYVAGAGFGVAHESDRSGSECFSDCSGCSSVRVRPLGGMGSYVLDNVGTRRRRHRVVRG